MKRKEAFNLKDCYFFGNRYPVDNWYTTFNVKQMTWLWEHGMIQWSKPIIEIGESPNTKFIEFTKRGRLWNEWYFDWWFFIKKHIFRVYDIRRLWRKLRIKMGHHYEWQDYEIPANLDEL